MNVRRFTTGLLAGIPALLLASCGSRGELRPAGQDAVDLRPQTIFVASSREISQNPREDYSGDRAAKLSFRHYSVYLPRNHVAGNVEWGNGAGTGSGFASRVKARFDNAAQFASGLRRSLALRKPVRRNVIIFVHGYNNTFAESLYRFAQFARDTDIPAIPVLYAWPSKGKTAGYVYDKDSAYFARDGLEKLLQVATQSGARHVALFAHSMGALLAMETLRQARLAGKSRLLNRIAPVILANPDIDSELFVSMVQRTRPLPRPFVIMASNRDKALKISQHLTGGENRLGQGSETDRRMLRRLGIILVDLGALKDGETSNHNQFASSREFLTLIATQLAKNKLSDNPGRITERVIHTTRSVGHSLVTVIAPAARRR
ncbi:MAG: alpha/beta fold hydrolase [Hyphomicrobiales bacterium]|nr:alpha/beta fold hydrolase [Hyphomicrobiales bacterium]